ncbi:MAG: MASE1 domain-containing protein, partial [Betaproteobacteria bacterium]|nr:MASE1 domain-containing protein [Betaproteobacteria bacterium]
MTPQNQIRLPGNWLQRLARLEGEPVQTATAFLTMLIGYWLLQEASVMLAHGHPPFPIWLADGFALGLWFVTAPRSRPPLLLAVLIANLIGSDLELKFTLNGLAGSVVNVFQLAAAAWLMAVTRRMLGNRWSRLVRILALAFVAAAVVNALAAVGSAYVFHYRNGIAVIDAFFTLFISDGLGIILLTPLVVAWADRSPAVRSTRKLAMRGEAVLVYFLVALSGGMIFSLRPDAFGLVPPVFYLGVPFVLWAAARFEMQGGTLALTLYSLIAIYFTTRDLGPFSAGFVPSASAVLQLQGFLAVLIVSTLMLSALVRDRRAASRETRGWRQRYEAALRSSGNAVFEIEPASGAIQWAGDTLSAFGIHEDTISTARGWTARIHPDDRSLVTGLRARLAGGTLASIDLEYRVRSDSGEYRLLGVSAYGVAQKVTDLDINGKPKIHIMGFVKDITEKNRLAAERQQLEAELRQAQKMDAIGRLAGGIAHDFNNILASILGYGELARDKVEDGGPLARYLDTIVKAGERGKLLVAQILTFSRKSTDAHEPVNLIEILNEVAALVRGSHPHQVEVRQYCSQKAATVVGNAVELHQMVMNLATNALQAMPEGGRLEIGINARDISAPHKVLQGSLRNGPHVIIEVSDQGTGIDAATRERMFDPFFTTKPVGKGTGLGLSMAMTIAKAHGGGIDLRSEPQKGSTFTIYLPADASVPAAADLQPALIRGRGQKILIADDDPALRELATQIMSELGYRCESHADGAEAWAAFEAHPDQYDALLSDEVMPNVTGSELATRI